MLRRSLGIHSSLPPPPVPVGVEYLRDGHLELEMDGDPEDESSGYDMTSLQIVPCHIAGIGALSFWRRELFPTVR